MTKIQSGPDICLKKQKISSFICLTNAITRGDSYLEAIKSHLLFSDELVIVDGNSTDGTLETIEKLDDPRIRIVTLDWPKEDWSWAEFATHWNLGYSSCTGDWVAAGETDHIWHPTEAARVVDFLNSPEYQNYDVLSAEKIQVITIDRCYNKGGLPYFVNKAKNGDKIGYGHDPNKHTDLAVPIFKEKEIYPLFWEGTVVENNKKLRMKFWNYLWTFKTKDMILKERLKGHNGWVKFYGKTKEYPGGPPRKHEYFVEQTSKDKFNKCNKLLAFSDHPDFMQSSILEKLKPNMFGYNCCGMADHQIPEDYFDKS